MFPLAMCQWDACAVDAFNKANFCLKEGSFLYNSPKYSSMTTLFSERHHRCVPRHPIHSVIEPVVYTRRCRRTIGNPSHFALTTVFFSLVKKRKGACLL
jgi:hypothetical protein